MEPISYTIEISGTIDKKNKYYAEFSQFLCYTNKKYEKECVLMYRVLIVDDEFPALRFVSSIIEHFSQAFKVVGTVSSGELALNFL